MGVHSETDIAGVASVIGDVSRTRVLLALCDGGTLTASALAAEAGVSSSTISEHLAKLCDAQLLTFERDGRRRYYRLATTDVAEALESLARIAQPIPIRSYNQDSRARALLRARLCYDHLAGRLGVDLMESLLTRHYVEADAGQHAASGDDPRPDATYVLSAAGRECLSEFGVPLPERGRDSVQVRYCIDWAERKPHLAGRHGAQLTANLFSRGWLQKGRGRRVVRVTATGLEGLERSFGLVVRQ